MYICRSGSMRERIAASSDQCLSNCCCDMNPMSAQPVVVICGGAPLCTVISIPNRALSYARLSAGRSLLRKAWFGSGSSDGVGWKFPCCPPHRDFA